MLAEMLLATLAAGACIGSSFFLIIVLALGIHRRGIMVTFELPEDGEG